jgi:hypothetical protein
MSQGTPLILLPSEPFNPRQIDPDFEHEREAAKAAGLDTALIDHSRVLEGAAAAAVARTPEAAGPAVYRGWMLKPHQYQAMHAALQSRGIALINTPEQYRTCHYEAQEFRARLVLVGHLLRLWVAADGSRLKETNPREVRP